MNKIKQKTQKLLRNLSMIFVEYDIEEVLFFEMIIDILGIFSIYRPDIGYMAGLEKILGNLLIVYIPYQDTKSNDFNKDAFENEIFSLLSNIILTSNHLPHFYLNNYDEISWRLNFFDTIFDRELP